MQPAGFLIMGVSGSGKTTVGKALAQKLGWDFFEAEGFHPAENIAKMTNGIPLSDLFAPLENLIDKIVAIYFSL